MSTITAELAADEAVVAVLSDAVEAMRRQMDTMAADYRLRLEATDAWRHEVTEWLVWEHAQLGKLLAVLAAIGGAAGDVQVGRVPAPPLWPLSDR